MAKNKRVRRKLGDLVVIPLGEGMNSFARVIMEPLIAFYNLRTSDIPSPETIIESPVAFAICVMNRAVTHGIWPVVGHVPLSEELLVEPLFFKEDPISGSLSTYRDSSAEEIPTTWEQCKHLECAAVWDPEHVVDRLNDYFAGRPNKWIESLKPRNV